MSIAIVLPDGRLLRIVEVPTGSATPAKDKCPELMKAMLDNWLQANDIDPLSPGFTQVYQDTLKKLVAWCHESL